MIKRFYIRCLEENNYLCGDHSLDTHKYAEHFRDYESAEEFLLYMYNEDLDGDIEDLSFEIVGIYKEIHN